VIKFNVIADDDTHFEDTSRSLEIEGHHIHEEEQAAPTEVVNVSHDEKAGQLVSDDEAVHQTRDGCEQPVDPQSAGATYSSLPDDDDDHTVPNGDAAYHHDHGRHADDYQAHAVGEEGESHYEAGGIVESEHEDEHALSHNHEEVRTEDNSHENVKVAYEEDQSVQNGHDGGIDNSRDECIVNGHEGGVVNGHHKENGSVANGLLPRQDSLAGVDEILQSPAIRREIDEIIGHQLKLAPAANDLLAMQQLSDYLLPKSHGVGAGHIGKGGFLYTNNGRQKCTDRSDTCSTLHLSVQK
jgi:hypothetical protein